MEILVLFRTQNLLRSVFGHHFFRSVRALRAVFPLVLQAQASTVCVYYGWMNIEAMAEGRKWNGYLRYEAVGAAACMA